jgi:nucleoside phosphorylase
MVWDPPLYLHFLDRELGRSVGFTLTPRVADEAMKILLLGTASRLYSGLSLAWESPGIAGPSAALFSAAVGSGALDLVSHHSTVSEFLESREELYRHDVMRYPMYFGAQSARAGLGPTQFKGTSTTSSLSADLTAWAQASFGYPDEGENGNAHRSLMRLVGRVLIEREGQAITYSLFAPAVDAAGMKALATGALSRRISVAYTNHYVAYGAGDVPTGVKGLEYFDELASHFPIFDVTLLRAALSATGHADALGSEWTEKSPWRQIEGWRGSPFHMAFRRELVTALRALTGSVSAGIRGQGVRVDRYGLRQSAMTALQAGAAVSRIPSRPAPPSFERSLESTRSLVSVLRRNREFAARMEQVVSEEGERTCDVLLVTVTDVERDAVLRYARDATGSDAVVAFGRRRTYHELGVIGGATALLMQIEMGSVGPGASLSAISDAIDDVDPRAVVMVGIAFGMDEGKQKLGDVLVSRQLWSYELQRVGSAADRSVQVTPRGDRITTSSAMLGRLRAAAAGWECPVKFGLIMSGEKLIDNVAFRNELLRLEPEAIGGEMEGAGLATAAGERKRDWVVVKAVCDWADGNKRKNKKSRQARAADAAARFVFRALGQGGFAARTSEGTGASDERR